MGERGGSKEFGAPRNPYSLCKFNQESRLGVLKLSVYEFCMCSRVSVFDWILCGMNWCYMHFVIENLVHLVLLSSHLCLTSVGWGFGVLRGSFG